MKNKLWFPCFVLLRSRPGLSAADLRLWYDQPATNWMTQALPVGNGQMGAMIFGGVQQEHIQFNVPACAGERRCFRATR